MQLTNDQIKAVSEWMGEHGIDPHLIEKFEGDWMKKEVRDEYGQLPLENYFNEEWHKFNKDNMPV